MERQAAGAWMTSPSVDLKVRLWGLPHSCTEDKLRHALQAAGFASPHPSRLFCWNGGAQLIVPLPEQRLPGGETPPAAARMKTGTAAIGTILRALQPELIAQPNYNFEMMPAARRADS